MKNINIYAVILAGGNGERLWPLSTPEFPKQFVSLFGGKPLIRHAADRLLDLIPFDHIFVVTADRFVGMTRKILPYLPKANVIGEPCRRDTAAAVAVACGLVKKYGGDDAVGCILTADQLMTPVKEFRQTLKDAIKAAIKSSSVITMGIVPDKPATGFGYIECGETSSLKLKTQFYGVKRFVEKPDKKTALKYLKKGGFYWNSGMFIWRAGVLADAFSRTAPDIGALIDKVAKSKNIRSLLKNEYANIRAISFDYAVMEKFDDILVAKSTFAWDDVGSWTSVANHFPKDDRANVSIGETLMCDVSDSIVVSEGGHLTALMGVSDLVVVNVKGVTLVCSKNRAHDIKKLRSCH